MVGSGPDPLLYLLKINVFPGFIRGRSLLLLRLGSLRLPCLSFLHISELLPHLPGRPGDGHNEVEYEAVQYIEYDREKEYFW